ncbi:hypothetical protein B0H11DRAFT_2237546 [Mycena galericulata]|nr:hypothetical protein B0H11DRAFT_2237546 [Mycena galericulata]
MHGLRTFWSTYHWIRKYKSAFPRETECPPTTHEYNDKVLHLLVRIHELQVYAWITGTREHLLQFDSLRKYKRAFPRATECPPTTHGYNDKVIHLLVGIHESQAHGLRVLGSTFYHSKAPEIQTRLSQSDRAPSNHPRIQRSSVGFNCKRVHGLRALGFTFYHSIAPGSTNTPFPKWPSALQPPTDTATHYYTSSVGFSTHRSVQYCRERELVA